MARGNVQEARNGGGTVLMRFSLRWADLRREDLAGRRRPMEGLGWPRDGILRLQTTNWVEH